MFRNTFYLSMGSSQLCSQNKGVFLFVICKYDLLLLIHDTPTQQARYAILIKDNLLIVIHNWGFCNKQITYPPPSKSLSFYFFLIQFFFGGGGKCFFKQSKAVSYCHSMYLPYQYLLQIRSGLFNVILGSQKPKWQSFRYQQSPKKDNIRPLYTRLLTRKDYKTMIDFPLSFLDLEALHILIQHHFDLYFYFYSSLVLLCTHID